LIESVSFAAPEMKKTWLAQLSAFVNQVVPMPPTEDWHFRTVAALLK